MVYTKAWFCSTFAIKMPYKDCLFAHWLQEFGVNNRKVCDVALIALKWPIWYFGGHLALLSVFSDSVSYEIKADMEAVIAHILNEFSNSNANVAQFACYTIVKIEQLLLKSLPGLLISIPLNFG